MIERFYTPASIVKSTIFASIAEAAGIDTEGFVMADSDFEGIRESASAQTHVSDEFNDVLIPCIDCRDDFVWTVGEQIFFRDKHLQNPPKRCKDCKKAKNKRLEAIELTRLTGKKHRIEVRAECARCSAVTTVPFYPSQGRPVYCRTCFAAMNGGIFNGAVAKH